MMKMGWEMLFSHTSDTPSHFSRGRGEVNLVPGIANMAKVQWANSNAKNDARWRLFPVPKFAVVALLMHHLFPRMLKSAYSLAFCVQAAFVANRQTTYKYLDSRLYWQFSCNSQRLRKRANQVRNNT